MNGTNPLDDFEALARNLKLETPPQVRVAAQVMRRVHMLRVKPERTLEWMAMGSCAATFVAVLVGYSLLSGSSTSLAAILQIMPPIGL